MTQTNGKYHEMTAAQSDELDSHFARFFRSRLPEPWPNAPGAEPVTERPSPERSRAPAKSGWKPRLVLAISVGLTLAGCWLLTGDPATPAGQPGGPSFFDHGTAKPPADLREPVVPVLPMEDLGGIDSLE